MSESVFVCVPGEPVGKGRPRIGRRGKHAMMYTPEKTADYEALVRDEASKSMAGRPLLSGPVRITLNMRHPIRPSWSKRKQQEALDNIIVPTIKCDADNCLKAICDAFNGVVWVDDVQVVEVILTKRFAAEPYVEATVETLPYGSA